MAAWGEVMAKATNRVGHPKSSDQYDPFTREYQAFLKGDKTAQEALDAIAAEWDALFNG